MHNLRSLPAPYFVVLLSSTAIAVLLIFSTAYALISSGILPRFANKDFANYWMASRLVLEGRSADLFGPQSVYFVHLRDAFGPLFPWHNWSYPPHYLLLIWPLGFFGYKTAMMIFLAVTGIFFLWSLFAFTGRNSILALAAASPFITHNFWVAQNGYLFAGLALGVLAFRRTHPVLAGIMLGLLTIKPQLGLLFPFLLMAERRWLTMAVATTTTVLLVAGSASIFGLSAWSGYIREVLPYQSLVMRELDGTFLSMMTSVYGMLRVWGIGADTALAVHLVVAVPALAVCLLAFFCSEDWHARSVILLVGTFLITPYALTYDLGLLVGALAMIPTLGKGDRPMAHKEQVILSIAMFLPIIMMIFGQLYIPIAPPVLVAILVFTLSRSDLRLQGYEGCRRVVDRARVKASDFLRQTDTVNSR